jgi:hypothetical protein
VRRHPAGRPRRTGLVHVSSCPRTSSASLVYPGHSATRPASRTARGVWQGGPHDH